MATETVNVGLGNDIVTNANLANMAQGTLKGRASGAGTGDPTDLTPDQASNVLDLATDPLIRTSASAANIITAVNNHVAQPDPHAQYQKESEKGAANGYAPLDASTKIAAAYLPAYVDDVEEYANLAAFPVTGETGKIYVALDSNKTYRWGGSSYTEISPSPGSTDAVTEGATNLYFTVARVRATLLTGLSLASSVAVAATDTVLEAFGKLQAFNGLFTTVGLAFGRLTNPSAVRYPRINADNTVTALTIAQLYSDLAATGFVARTGSALAFDLNATYNSPTSPGSASVTLDTTGAVAGVEVVGYFNHSVEPTWPAGITAVGTWFNSGLNVVRFVYIDASNISAVISNERPVSEWQIVRKSSATTRTSTATLAADPTLSIPIAANQSVIIRGFITVTSAATPDFKYRLTGPATPSEVRIQCVHGAASGVTAPSNAVRDAYDSADLVFLMTGTQSGTILVNMEVVNGANSGNIAFEWAQNTSDAGNTTVRTNSYLEYQYA